MATQVDAVSEAQEADVVRAAMQDVLEAQRKAVLAESPVPPSVRIDRLERARALLVDHRHALADAMAEDYGGRPELLSLFSDIAPSVKALAFAKKHLRRWMRPERRRLEFPLGLLGAKAWIEYQPKGVVGLISPWNFPVNLTFAPLAGILAAGNRVMIKPSEITPATSETMARLIRDYFDETEITVITGGPEVGQAFASLPFDHLLFTGATSIGRHVMRAAADNLTPVTLELGGKSPVIVSRSADPAETARRVVVGKMMNAGQICLAPDYMLVPAEDEDDIAEALVTAASALYPTVKANPDYTPVVNARHKARLMAHIADAERQGAEITVVNPAGEDFTADENSTVLPLHILRKVTDDMTVMQEEIFGPLLPVVGYASIEDAIAYVNARPRPLGLYYFGRDGEEERRVLDRTVSGGVTLGDVLWHVAHEDLPFGGIGPSGMGVYHGRDGFRTFSHARSIYRQSRLNVGRLIGAEPPYGTRLRKVVEMQIRK